jgi:hypothetical protein
LIISGPFSKVMMQNTVTGDQLNMLYDAVEGEQVIIDLHTLTVTNNAGSNLMRYMSTPYADVDSDLITFGLYPNPQVSGGLNTMLVSISDAVLGKTQSNMYWQSCYIAV